MRVGHGPQLSRRNTKNKKESSSGNFRQSKTVRFHMAAPPRKGKSSGKSSFVLAVAFRGWRSLRSDGFSWCWWLRHFTWISEFLFLLFLFSGGENVSDDGEGTESRRRDREKLTSPSFPEFWNMWIWKLSVLVFHPPGRLPAGEEDFACMFSVLLMQEIVVGSFRFQSSLLPTPDKMEIIYVLSVRKPHVWPRDGLNAIKPH